jgi:hypothetical protein
MAWLNQNEILGLPHLGAEYLDGKQGRILDFIAASLYNGRILESI